MTLMKKALAVILVMTFISSFFTVSYAKQESSGGNNQYTQNGNGKNDHDEHYHNQANNSNTPITLSADVQILQTLGFLNGTGKDGLSLSYTKSKPTRYQALVIYLRLINQEINLNNFDHSKHDNFKDCKGQSNYVQKVMGFAKSHPEFNWIGSHGKFEPMSHITAKQFAKVLLTALGYTYGSDFTWDNVEAFAEGLGIDVPDGDFTFEKLSTMTVKALLSNTKSGKRLIDVLAAANPEFAAKAATLNLTTVVTDTTLPFITDLVLSSPYIAQPQTNGKVIIYFSEAMQEATLSSLSNYAVDLDGSLGANSIEVLLSTIQGASAAVSGDKKSVTLTIPGNLLAGGFAPASGVTEIKITGVKDLAGNVISTVTRFVRVAALQTVIMAEATEVNQLQVTFSNPLQNVDAGEFKLYGADGVTLFATGINFTIDSSKKVVTITLNNALTAEAKTTLTDSTTAKLVIGTTLTKDIFGNAVSGSVVVPVVNSTTPATVQVSDKISPTVSSLVKGTLPFTIEMTFSEPVNAIDNATLASALRVKDLNGVLQNVTYTFSGGLGTVNDFTKLALTVVNGTENKYAVEVLPQGIKDTGTNNVVKALPSTTVTVENNVLPVILSAETQDLNQNGKLDAIKVTFNKHIKDSTVNANAFDVLGYSFEAFNPTTNGDAANDGVIYITFPESGTADTAATPTIKYTQGSLEDIQGLKLATTGAILTTDKASPIVMTAIPVGALTASSFVQLILSEAITDASKTAVLAAIQANRTILDNGTTGNVVYSETWTTNNILTLSITGDVTDEDKLVYSTTTTNLIDTAGNTLSQQVVK